MKVLYAPLCSYKINAGGYANKQVFPITSVRLSSPPQASALSPRLNWLTTSTSCFETPALSPAFSKNTFHHSPTLRQFLRLLHKQYKNKNHSCIISTLSHLGISAYWLGHSMWSTTNHHQRYSPFSISSTFFDHLRIPTWLRQGGPIRSQCRFRPRQGHSMQNSRKYAALTRSGISHPTFALDSP